MIWEAKSTEQRKYTKVCRHWSSIWERRIHAIIYVRHKNQSMVACFIIKMIAKIFIFLYLCLIYSNDLLKSRTITSTKKQPFKYERTGKKSFIIYTLDNKTIAYNECEERKKKRVAISTKEDKIYWKANRIVYTIL